MLAKYFGLTFACAILVRAQTSDAPTLTASISPATETVAANSTHANVPLFKNEAIQLTDDVVTYIQENPDLSQYASLFEFEDTVNSTLPARVRRARRSQRCKTMPGDLLYPGKLTWGIFDLLLGGALEKIVPIGSPCYKTSEFNNYDAERCNSTNGCSYGDNGALMSPLYSGLTCEIPASGNYTRGKCTQGGFSSYAVKVENVAQIQLAINFARSLDLRLVIRNTGHDYNGRSIAKGALSIWTHGLKEIQYVADYQDTEYTGPVFKVGAGVQGFELYQAAEKYGVTAVAGICPTVGVTGGYTTGGGHSPVMQLFGVGADQVVALEVVLTSGRFVTVTPSVNSDLYWAMLGGGGGTFGVVVSAVVKVHRKIPVTTATWTIVTSDSVSEATFWKAFRFFWDSFPAYNEAKTYSYFSLIKVAPRAYSWSMGPFFATDMSIAQYEALLKPFYQKCAELGIAFAPEVKHYDSFYPAYQATFAPLNFRVGRAVSTPGNRILPVENWETEDIRDQTFAALKNAVDKSLLLRVYHQHPADSENKDLNSVNPAFRNEASMVIIVNSITDTSAAGYKAANAILTNDLIGGLRKVSPAGGSYANEAEISEPDWQNAFWGKNYPRLLTIKKQYDPTDLFYVHHGVGSENWAVDDKGIVGVQSQDGPLCRV
ncbi:hypothetical protein P153DRAFT_403119 [Dothidotthia symphoricarpi CBS 119687]|uniref:FAD-binding PCMH-type domain-containing protein n=1 Tax=Dothidotthia symphoricarpi CBS 119687 TaxID=1392245 RepID=A0A6A6AEN0_9PLEO|nr:uncharacterized protein P153DRAFT_403119 [Dothidotthia symphoricarpi CBS 119687]KAF2129387.1 hypothetical protein P153DRAFT_403119 [Dothidotthia symphoricarpi CBS 119687]